MMVNKIWAPEAWDDYVWWQTQDRKTLKRINSLIKDIERGSMYEGIGKPEPLRGELSDSGQGELMIKIVLFIVYVMGISKSLHVDHIMVLDRRSRRSVV